MRREYPDNPIVAVGVVVMDGERVLLIQRGKEPNRGRWSLPGGAVELGETVRQAAAREIEEECGVEIEPGDLIEVLDAISPGENGRPRFHYVLVELLADYTGGQAAAATDAREVGWFTLDEIESLDIPAITLAILRQGADMHRRNQGQANKAGERTWQREFWS